MPDSDGLLFEHELSFLPQLYEEETLFSWAARFHRLSGNGLASQTSLQLFGDKRAGLKPDFPSHLDQLVRITQGQIGDAKSLAFERTMFGFFAPLLDADDAFEVETLMRGTSVEKVKSLLGLQPSRIGGFFPLKACPDCIREELARLSVSSWHLEHQWPSVWICRKHSKPLHYLKRDAQPRDLRRWLLPEDVKDNEWLKPEVKLLGVKRKLFWLAEVSHHFAQQYNKHFDCKLLRYTYLLCAKERGWLFTDGSLKLKEVRREFLKYYRGLEAIPGFECVQSVVAEQGGMLSLLMRQYHWRRHPLKHLLLIAFLYDSTADFEATHTRICHAYAIGGTRALDEMVGESWKSELKRLVEVDQMSLNSAAVEIGIPLHVAIRVANQEGITYQRKPHVLNTTLGENIFAMIGEGLSREEIFQKTGIKKSLLKDLMARVPALRDEWRRMDFERRRCRYRENFLNLVDQYRGVPIKKLRIVSGNGVSWLYRNDREWLGNNLPSIIL
jgi:hypothetical protein